MMRACVIGSAIRTRPSLYQVSMMETPFQVGGAKNPRLPPPSPVSRAMASSRDRQATGISHPCQLCIEEAKLQEDAAEKLGALFFRLPLGPWGRGSHSHMAC